MYLVRGLLALATTAAWLLASMAVTASAQMQIFEEDNGPCPEVTIEGHHVEGGCQVEYRSTMHFTRIFYLPVLPGIAYVSQCDMHFTGRVGPDGYGYVSEARFEDESPPAERPCADAPCDEATHEMIPWPLQITESGPSDERVILDICRRLAPNVEEGTPGTWCYLDMPLTDTGQHTQEIGDQSEHPCDSSWPPLPMTLDTVHLVNEETGPEAPPGIELVH